MFISSKTASASSPRLAEKFSKGSLGSGVQRMPCPEEIGEFPMLITHPLSPKHLMEDERDSADILHSARSDPSGSRSGFKLSAKLRARMEKLEKWRISLSSIKAPKNARQFHGGHATVSKAFLAGRIDYSDNRFYILSGPKSYKPREYMQLCRQSSESDDHIRGSADGRRDAEGELGDEGTDDEQECGSDRGSRWVGKFVAVKKSRIGDNKDLARVLGFALRETEFLVGLSHPNIVKLEGFVGDLSKDIIWLVFPWADNGNLKDFVASRDWEIPERISLINDVARGLEYLHSQNPPICHGDLKSFNVLVNSDYCAVITDFGSARRLTEHDPNRQPRLFQNQQQPVQAMFSTLSKTITLTGNIYTLRWAAPELLNDDQISLGSDIWALGWIAYEVLTNSIPFQDVPADAAVVERVIKGDLPSINEHARVSLFEKFCSLMTMCWNSNPSERPTAKDYLHVIGDMPMYVPEMSHSPTFGTSSSVVLIHRGEAARMSGDSGMAFACFTGAYRFYTRAGDTLCKAGALAYLAEVHVDQKDYKEAIKLCSKALQIHTDIGNREGRADASWSLAEVHRLRSEFNEAIALRSEGLQSRTDIDCRGARADALWCLGEVQRLQRKYREAITHLSEAVQIRTDLGDRIGQASALTSLARVHRYRTTCGEAIKLYSEVLQIFTDIGDRRGQASALSGLAQVHLLRREYSEAIKLFSEALQIRPDIDDSRGRASALSSLAQLDLQGEYSKAIKLYSEALQIRPNTDDSRGRGSALSSLAQSDHLQGEYSEAIKLYSEALQIYTDVGNKKGRASALSSLARVHRYRKEYSEAIKLYSEALQVRPDIDDRRGRASALSSLAQSDHLRGEYSEAIKLYSEALQIRPNIDDSRGRASALSSLARVHQYRKEYSKAIKLYTEALQIYTDVGNKKGRASALLGLADIHCRQDHHDHATSLYEQASKSFKQSGHGDAAAYALKKAADARRRLKLIRAA